MIKLRTTQAFKNAITNARSVFGVSDNSCTQICKRALRWYGPKDITIPKLNGKGLGSPTTIRIDTRLNNKDFQMIVIMYVNEQIEKYSSKIQKPLQLDKCEIYEIKESE